MNFEAAIKDLQDSLAIMAHLEQRHSKPRHDQAANEFQRRIDQNLIEITAKLNRLINRSSATDSLLP
jgi:hypothetical protein